MGQGVEADASAQRPSGPCTDHEHRRSSWSTGTHSSVRQADCPRASQVMVVRGGRRSRPGAQMLPTRPAPPRPRALTPPSSSKGETRDEAPEDDHTRVGSRTDGCRHDERTGRHGIDELQRQLVVRRTDTDELRQDMAVGRPCVRFRPGQRELQTPWRSRDHPPDRSAEPSPLCRGLTRGCPLGRALRDKGALALRSLVYDAGLNPTRRSPAGTPSTDGVPAPPRPH